MSFVGPRFKYGFDSSTALAYEWEQATHHTPTEAAEFFRRSHSYLYNLAIWEASGNRPAYVAVAAPLLSRLKSKRLIDYGCGIGSDTLALRSLGMHVTPCDFDSPSTRFFQWRACRLRQDGHFYEPGCLPRDLRADALWIIDTLDHLPDLELNIGPILARVQIVVCEQLAQNRGHGSQGFHHRRPSGEIASLFGRYGFRLEISRQEVQGWIRER
jgi:SAM-dependent methyltransferase